MGKREGKRAVTKKNIRILSLLLLAVAFVITCISVLTAVMPKHYDVKIGEVSPYTIYATRNVADEASTETQRDAARAMRSALKTQRSSRLPPPRATMISST